MCREREPASRRQPAAWRQAGQGSMKKLGHIAILALLGAPTALFLLLTGCETGSANSPVTVTPAAVNATLPGEEITFTATGGYDYRWSLSSSAWGYLANDRGNVVTYIVTTRPDASDQNVTLAVVSTIEGAGTSADGKSYEMLGEAFIRHRSRLGGAAATTTTTTVTTTTTTSVTTTTLNPSIYNNPYLGY